MKEALLYKPVEAGKVVCTACARYCRIGEGQIGLCGVRQNLEGKLQLLVYGKVIAGHVDPIEKKPVIHYMPGAKIFSIATTGCNWLCSYCIPGESIISTNRGMTPVSALWSLGVKARPTETGEVVDLQGVRVWTHRGRLQRARQVHRHFYSDKLLEIDPVYLAPLRCTPEHRVFAAAGKSARVRKVPAKELEAGDFVAIPKTAARSERVTLDVLEILLSLPQPPYKRNVQLVEEGGAVRYNFGRARGIPRFIPLDEDFARLLGYYAAEGSFSKATGRPNSCSAWFSFGSSERKRQDEVVRIVKRLTGQTPTRNEQHNRTALVVSNTPLALVLRKLCGEGAKKKRVPDVLLSSTDPEPIRAFLAGYLNGDGYLTETRSGTILGSTSVSETLTRGVVELFLRLGTVPRYYVSRNPSEYVIEGRTVSRSDDYMTRVLVESVRMRPDELNWTPRSPQTIETSDYFLLPIRKITSFTYVGYVYNLAVERDNSYIADFIAVANCQNYDISQRRKVQGTDINPQGVVDLTIEQGAQGIAYTYNQPTIFMEFAHDIGVLAREAGLINIFVSNGYDTPETIAMMPDFLDAITVDFKGNGEPKFVRRYIGIPDPQPIFDSLIEMRDKTDVHIEITDLVVPQVGDDLQYAQKLSQFVYDELGPDTPIHFLRFHPDYKMMDLPLTPIETLEKHHRVAKEVGLNYVYIGNVPGHPLEHTYCPGCGRIAIRRHGFDIQGWGLDDQNRCQECGYQLPIVGALQDTWQKIRFRPVM